jgi:hypothetical protein
LRPARDRRQRASRGLRRENSVHSGLAIFVVWPLTVALTAPSNSEQERAYLVIEETTSPNGQCAVAWTLPKGPQIDCEKFRSGELSSDYLPDLDDPKSDIQVKDNLIELKSGRKLAIR